MQTHTITFDGEDFEVADGFAQLEHTAGHQFGNSWERFCCNVVCGEIESNKTFLDVGANLGAYTVLAAKRTSRNVFAFEPDKDNYQVLCDNTSKFPNVHTYNSALGEINGYGQLALNTAGNIGAHKICAYEPNLIEDGRPDYTCTVRVPVCTINRVCNFGAEIFDIVKIDVEGHAMQVLRGGEWSLRQASIILVEFHELCSFTKKPTDEIHVPELLRSFGFAVSNVILTHMVGETPWRRIGGFVGAKNLTVMEKYLVKKENGSC